MSPTPKPIRILGLHGMGTSASILRSQTAAFRAKLPPHITFTFLDAPFFCDAAPGTDILFAPGTGHRAWWTGADTNAIRGAARLFAEHLASDEGPFDIVLGFSQGCALIASYLLYLAEENEKARPAFGAAVFVCGGVPLPALEDLGVDVTDKAREVNDRTSRGLKKKAGAIVGLAGNLGQIRPGVGLWDDLEGLVHDPEKMPTEEDVFGLDFTTMPEWLRIRVPAVHVYGAKDPRWPASVQLAHFCEDRRLYDHGGGHEIPRTTEVSNRIAELVMELVGELEKKAK
ncbi:family of serine hydrolases 1 [Staphylotrichum tortipilum]|uniref:Family of serine hydrolases 1 n=1 Tax=Staphylotrichum tortipilum TaxID=2831512 RepID=A0AAN6MMP7_9PEZI|nr:family of serine hydrolases 1 [Staphylotrichum longicolle]